MTGSKSQKSLGRAFLSSPLAVVLSVAMVVVFVMSFAGYVRRGGFWSPEVEARVFNERVCCRNRQRPPRTALYPLSAFLALHYALPFLLLLFRNIKMRPVLLRTV